MGKKKDFDWLICDAHNIYVTHYTHTNTHTHTHTLIHICMKCEGELGFILYVFLFQCRQFAEQDL